MGADIASVISQLVLAQTTDAREGFILIAQLNVTALDQVFDLADFDQRYYSKGRGVFSSITHDLQLSLLGTNRRFCRKQFIGTNKG
jgi:hypothetical protein